MRVVTAGLVTLALLGFGAAGASANTGLTFSANGSPLSQGSELKGSSSPFVFSTPPATVECQENILQGEFGVVGTEEASVNVLSESSTGPFGAPCTASGGKQAFVRAFGPPSKITLKPGVLQAFVSLQVEILGESTCTYTGKIQNAPYNIGGPMVAQLTRVKLKASSPGSPGCRKGFAELTGALSFTSGGYDVEAEYNSPPPGTVTGTVTETSHAAVPNVTMTLCNETTLACYATTTNGSGEYTKSVPAGSYEVTAAPEASSGYASVIAYELKVIASQTATYSPTLPVGGVVRGTITELSSNPVPGVVVSVCDLECYESVTNSAGEYLVTVPPGTYEIEASPPTGYQTIEAGPFSVAASATVTENFIVQNPVPPPAGTTVQGFSSAQVNGHAIPIVNWGAKAPITTDACPGGTVVVTVTGVNDNTHVIESTTPITLTEVSSGEFSGEIEPLYPIHGEGVVKISVSNCSGPGDGSVEFTLYIDPSGLVVDGNDGSAPLAGATVTLLAGPKRTGPFSPVANGSSVMSPGNRVNPDASNAAGEFGWDTTPGFYEVEASEAGCGTAVVGPFEVPPAQVGLKLVLHCTIRVDSTSLPEATLGQPYSFTLAASGVEMPFKWKKLAALPKGLKLSKTGVLSGTMKATKVSPGTYPIEVQVANHAKEKATATLNLKVG